MWAKDKALFQKGLIQALCKWKKEKKPTILHLSSPSKPLLDPRKGGSRDCTTILRLLFEGLTRFDKKGKLILSLAKKCALSNDQKQYTIALRKTFWSNGTFVTAYDFAYAWKTALAPDFSIDFPELFYVIKNAKKAREGKVSLAQVGIKVKNENTLMIDLKHPIPDFLERLAHTLFFPIPSKIACQNPYWFKQEGNAFVCNGPFCLENPKKSLLFSLKKNSRYIHRKRIKIDQISILQVSTTEAIQLFKENKLDFFEIPNRREGSLALEKQDVESLSFPAPKILWFSLNTTSFPLNNLHFRMALASSLNREKIKNFFPLKQESAYTPLPLGLTQNKNSPSWIQYNPGRAQVYLNQALLELGLKKEALLSLSIMIPENRLRKTMADVLKEEWETTLSLRCIIEAYPYEEFYKRRIAKKFQIAMVEWGAPTSDPLSTLSAFKHKEEKLNLSCWEHPHYQKLLTIAEKEMNPQKRILLIKELEAMLMRHVCVLPIFYGQLHLLKNPAMIFFPLASTFNGTPDFSHVSFKQKEQT